MAMFQMLLLLLLETLLRPMLLYHLFLKVCLYILGVRPTNILTGLKGVSTMLMSPYLDAKKINTTRSLIINSTSDWFQLDFWPKHRLDSRRTTECIHPLLDFPCLVYSIMLERRVSPPVGY